MSVSKDEMRAAIYKNWACHKNRTRVDFQMFQAVFALIEHGPEVSRKRISQLLAQLPSWDTEVCIMQYLRECGVTVKEGK